MVIALIHTPSKNNRGSREFLKVWGYGVTLHHIKGFIPISCIKELSVYQKKVNINLIICIFYMSLIVAKRY